MTLQCGSVLECRWGVSHAYLHRSQCSRFVLTWLLGKPFHGEACGLVVKTSPAKDLRIRRTQCIEKKRTKLCQQEGGTEGIPGKKMAPTLSEKVTTYGGQHTLGSPRALGSPSRQGKQCTADGFCAALAPGQLPYCCTQLHKAKRICSDFPIPSGYEF